MVGWEEMAIGLCQTNHTTTGLGSWNEEASIVGLRLES